MGRSHNAAGAPPTKLTKNPTEVQPLNAITTVGIQCSVPRVTKLRGAPLRKSRTLLRIMERLAEIGVWEWDAVQDVLVWSDEVYRMFGRNSRDWIPSIPNVIACIHPDDRQLFQDTLETSLNHNERLSIKFRIIWPDGTGRNIHSRLERTLDHAGKAVAVTGTCHDITARTQAEDALRASEERFRLLVENAPDAIMLYDADQFRFIDANPQAEVLFGCGREEIIKHGPEYFYAQEQPDKLPLSQSIAEHVRLTQAGQQLVYKRSVRRPSGEKRLCEVTLLRLPSSRDTRFRVSIVDITEREAAARKLQRVTRALRTLSRGNEVVVRASDEGELFDGMCRAVTEIGGYRMAWIGTVEHDAAKTVRLVASAGDGADRLASWLKLTWADVPFGQGTTGRAIRTGKPQTNNNIWTHPNLAPYAGMASEYDVVSAASLPLKDDTGVFAVLLIYSTDTKAFDEEELELLQELAEDLSYGFRALRDRRQKAESAQRWREGLETMIGAIAGTLEKRDPYTAGHQQRVARLAVGIARKLGISDHDVDGIRLASIIHDVGKISVPAEILSKPGKLSQLEFALIQEHAEAGYDNVKGVAFPWPIAEMVRQHHERLDGSGYPLGLKGDAILVGARIIAVADVIDAMMSYRPYRPALGMEAALAEVEKEKGRLFDPAVVDACIALFRDKDFGFDAASESEDTLMPDRGRK